MNKKTKKQKEPMNFKVALKSHSKSCTQIMQKTIALKLLLSYSSSYQTML